MCFHQVHPLFFFAEVSNFIFILTSFPLWLLCCEFSCKSLTSDKVTGKSPIFPSSAFIIVVVVVVFNIVHGEKRQKRNKTKGFMGGEGGVSEL